MSARGRRWLWIMLAVGSAARLVIAFTTVGVPFDIESARLVGAELDDRPLHVYAILNDPMAGGDIGLSRYPYPPGFFLWIAASWVLEEASGLPFHGLISLPSIVADAAIAWSVQYFLGMRGAGERLRLAAVALVALGPTFGMVAGYQGQIDSVAILPAVLALIVWESPGVRRRALVAGVLIGVGAAVKTAPLLMLLALVPSVRSLREGVVLVSAALAVPAAALAPFFVAEPSGTATIFDYAGVPGLGGLSLVVEPSLAGDWLTNRMPLELSSWSQTLHDHAGLIVLVALAGTGLALLRYRPSAVDAAVLLWLAVYTFIPNLFLQYLVWGLPFFIMAGYLRKVALIQALLVVPALLHFTRPWPNDDIAFVYVPPMIGFVVISAVALVLFARRVVISRRSNPRGVLPPLTAPALRRRAYAADSGRTA
jgi:hypothetical protein